MEETNQETKQDIMDKSNKKHPSFKLFKKTLKKILSKPPANLAIKLFNNYEKIIATNGINISKILTENELEQVKTYEAPRLDFRNNDWYFSNETETAQAITANLIKCYDSIIGRIAIDDNTREYSYKKVKEVEDDLIIFGEENTINDLYLNLFYNVDLSIEFNKSIVADSLQVHGKVQTCNFSVNNLASFKSMPTKYSIKCTAKNQLGAECSNSVEFCDIHKHSSIRCTDNYNTMEKGHVIKNLDDAQVIERKKFYHYIVKDLTGSNVEQDEKEFEALSMVPIDDEDIICNCILSNVGKEEIIFILAIKKIDRKKLDQAILIRKEENETALDDIFESMKKYYKKYHNFSLNNKNKYVAKVMLFQAITNIFFKERFHSFIMGKSGSGKSIYSKIIYPMFSFNYQYVIGTSITENRFLGGQDKFKNYLPGYAATQNFVFFEEASSALNFYHNSQEQKFGTNKNNLFEMLKNATGSEYNTSQQGSITCYPRASFTLVGNLEHLSLLKEAYEKAVAKQYKKFSEGHKNYDFTLPLFKPLEYYSKIIGDEALARAHAYVRLTKYASKYYMTGLPEAEQARFIFNIILEEDKESQKGVTKIPFNLGKEGKRFKVHRKDFMDELSFLNDYKLDEEFKKQIVEYYYEEFLNGRNNFIRKKNEDLNNHVKEGLFKAIYYFIVIEKFYWKEEMTLTALDKAKIVKFFKNNYNSLNLRESAEESTPFFNDFEIVDTNNLKNLELIKNEEYYLKRKDEVAELNKQIRDDDIVTSKPDQDLDDIDDIFKEISTQEVL